MEWRPTKRGVKVTKQQGETEKLSPIRAGKGDVMSHAPWAPAPAPGPGKGHGWKMCAL